MQNDGSGTASRHPGPSISAALTVSSSAYQTKNGTVAAAKCVKQNSAMGPNATARRIFIPSESVAPDFMLSSRKRTGSFVAFFWSI
jgi:hypothetical protein